MIKTDKEKKIAVGLYLDKRSGLVDIYRTLYFLIRNTFVPYDIYILDDRDGETLPGIHGELSHMNVIDVSGGSVKRSYGRAAAFNRLRELEAEIFTFLDTGVLVTPYWLGRIVRALDASAKYGFAGPSSNNCWNEQALFYDSAREPVDIDHRASEVWKTYQQAVQLITPRYSLIESCFVFNRQAAESINRADESYGSGYCWEMDIQARAAQTGFDSIWVKGVYVHRTAALLEPDPQREATFHINKQLYRKKFGDYSGDNRVNVFQTNEYPPLVSCIMPTRGRPGYVPQAIKYFLEQDYPECELIVVYENPTDLPAGFPEEQEDPRIRFIRTSPGVSIGFKRNTGCREARGDIIAQWDDDDWYSPGRISIQVRPILENRSDITALKNHLFLELHKQRFWICRPDLYDRMFVEGVAGGTLVYHRRILHNEECRYPDASLREDADFLVNAMRRGARLEKTDGYDHFIYLRHNANSWSFVSGSFLDPSGWHIVATPDFFQHDAEFYRFASGINQEPEKLSIAPRTGSVEAPQLPGGFVFGIKRTPMVSCIMPTANRRQLIPFAVENFLTQDYRDKELIIIDDGDMPVNDLIPQGQPIRYMRLNRKISVGEKRNRACSLARGKVIIHWDDDDWYGSGWISFQVNHLTTGNIHVTGLDQPYFYDPYWDKAWQYIYPAGENRGREEWVHGGTLCYWKSFWETNRFPDIDVGEDLDFLWSGNDKRILPHRGIFLYVAMIHDNNVSPKHTWDKRFNERHPSYVRKFMGANFKPYRETMEHFRIARNTRSEDVLLFPDSYIMRYGYSSNTTEF